MVIMNFRTIAPTENKFVSILAFGEGFHNYHHVFPWDYKTSEFGFYSLNLTKAFIDFFAKIGKIFLFFILKSDRPFYKEKIN